MAKKIKTIHDRINFAIRKGQTGYFSPAQIDVEIFAEINNLWQKYVGEFERARLISVYLNPFIRTEDVSPNPSDGSVTLPNAYHYPIGVRVKASGKDITELDQARWDKRVNHPIEVPTADYPICKFENKKIIVRPIDLGDVTVSYIKKPTLQVYAYTPSGDRFIYDDASSVDVEFDEILHDNIVSRVLSNLGVPMREEFLIRSSAKDKLEEGK